MDSSTENKKLSHSLKPTPKTLRRAWVVFGPDPDELVQVMGSENGRVPSEVIEVVHDDSNEQVQHEEGTEEDERDEVSVSQSRSTSLDFDSRCGEVSRVHYGVGSGRVVGVSVHRGHVVQYGVVGQRPRFTRSSGFAGKHNTWPSFSRGAPRHHVKVIVVEHVLYTFWEENASQGENETQRRRMKPTQCPQTHLTCLNSNMIPWNTVWKLVWRFMSSSGSNAISPKT